MNKFVRVFAIGVTVAMLLRLAADEFGKKRRCPRCGCGVEMAE